MYDRVRLVELVESALDNHQYCPVCGAHNVIAEVDGDLVLRCAAASAPASVLARIGAAMLPHEYRRIVDREELLAA
jgi:hypothetical protein